ncbi:probable serine/threonine-protein kinase CST [Rosa chinensis]|uniref:probable serine/threonine-protein kinase CST n=1 Tax=Rosa chinensis TaxID=74649 RepID=UPI000D0873CE|nr:probable serine/threonine-protein kinase CST [Rosa chinensis]XP_024181736.1 probable serine/threonine-protein kinase CST [Rosa chinensis]
MVIVGEFVGGAVLGAAFGVLFDVVKKAVDKPTAFKSLLQNIKFSLEFLKPVIEKIGEHNVELGLPDEEIKHLITEMKEGVKLVQKSSKVSNWNCMRSYYTDQLIELDGSLKRLFHILMVQGVRDAKETLILARKHQDQLIETAKDAKETLVLAQKNTSQLTESVNDGKETLELARKNADQSAKDGKETLVLARKTRRLLKRIERLVTCTSKVKFKPATSTVSVTPVNKQVTAHNGNKIPKASRRAGRNRVLEASNLIVYRFAELVNATENFKSSGGDFVGTFKGWVDENTLAPSKVGTGMAVAVKRLNPESVEDFKQWQLSVNFLGRLSHPNLVKLLGYCRENKELLLVYEFMPNGSLFNHLSRRNPDEEPLCWDNRLRIAIGAAQVLTLLHILQIIHRDVTPSNILLDEDYNTKIMDFSLSEWGPADGKLHVSTKICGTMGYIDPDYLRTGHLSVKSDVYSFGVVLLEILTGLKTIDFSRPKEQIKLVDWATPLLCDETKLQTIMDEQIKGQYPSQEALQTAQLTLRCLETDPERRPSMKEVVEELEHIRGLKEKPSQSKLTTMQSSSSSQ